VTTVPVSFSAIAPELVLLGAACILLTGIVFLPPGRRATQASWAIAALAFVGAGIAAGVLFTQETRYAFDHTIRLDAFGEAVRILVFAAAFATIATSWGLGDLHERALEYYAVLLVGAAGMSLLAVANSFLIVFVALELFSVALYILVAISAEEPWSLEGGLKYLIVGSIGAAFLLYGAALVYGSTGALEFDRIRAAAAQGDAHAPLLLTGIALLLAGLAFKSNAAPFHMWTPDAYEGAPTPITGFMSAATKAVALGTLIRVLVSSFPEQSDVWQAALGGIAIASFAVGNLAALRQSNVKRMLAYSTIGHTGFLFTAVAAHSELGARALVFYLAVYAAMNLGAFAVVTVRESEIGRPAEIGDFAGWGYRRPTLAAAMMLFLLSLAGFPPTGGFLGKLYVFSAAVDADQTYLAVAGVIATMVALVYYLRLPMAMYDRDLAVPEARASAGLRLNGVATGACAVAVLGAGIIPGPLITFATHAGNSLPFG
jgi:NADH-quinone oxidoreductase subunit N